MVSFDEIDEARKLLGLGEHATLKQIRHSYRQMAFCYHPDREGSPSEKMMKELNAAYKLLIDYCANYSYPFKEQDVARTYPHDEYLRRFYYGWFDGI